MPKLSPAHSEKNRIALENAALRCFVKHGYHGVSVREIADKAGVSLGNLYNYFPDKLSIFKGVLQRRSEDFLRPDNAFSRYLASSDFPNDLPELGAAIADNVHRYRDYMKLMYVDVVEFDGRHISETFSHLDEKFRAVLGARFDRIGGLGRAGAIDPALAFIAVYMGFYQFFILTKLFGAKATYGARSDGEVIQALSQLFLDGIAPKKRRA
jgi:AcrR family transcriptional regulator